jgi:hypothetical protein
MATVISLSPFDIVAGDALEATPVVPLLELLVLQATNKTLIINSSNNPL